MVRKDAAEGRAYNTGTAKRTVTETEPAGVAQTARLTLRNGVWYAGETPCKDYRDALKRTLLAASVTEGPLKSRREKLKPSESEKRWPRTRVRLELRLWCEAYFDARAARLAGQTVPVEGESPPGAPLRSRAAGGGR
jgi:hypothetical protein